jgi:hypothetical protein
MTRRAATIRSMDMPSPRGLGAWLVASRSPATREARVVMRVGRVDWSRKLLIKLRLGRGMNEKRKEKMFMQGTMSMMPEAAMMRPQRMPVPVFSWYSRIGLPSSMEEFYRMMKVRACQRGGGGVVNLPRASDSLRRTDQARVAMVGQ